MQPFNIQVMNLHSKLISQGNFLFRYRSYFPVLLFVLAVPFVFMSSHNPYLMTLDFPATVFSLLVCAAGFIVRSYAIGTTPKGTSGRNTREQVAEKLNTSGIYSVVRHPLYLGNYLIWAGIVLFTFCIIFYIIFSLLFWIYYERIMAAEEDFISRKFDQAFEDWASKTPAFFPSLKHYTPTLLPFSFKTVLRREYSGFLATVISFTYIDYLRFFITDNRLLEVRLSLYILAVSVVITLILRTLKHHTPILSEKDRS